MLQNADHGHQQDLPYKIKIKIKSEAEKVEAEEAKGGRTIVAVRSYRLSSASPFQHRIFK